MTGETNKNSGIFSFQISKADIGPFAIDLLKLKPEARSPLKKAVSGYKPGSAKPGKELQAAAKDKDVRKAARILAKPELVMENRNGGGSQPLNFFTACCAPSIDKQAFAVVTPSFEGAYLIQLFDNPWLYLAWWISLYASNTEEPAPNFIPPSVRLEQLIYLLHAIDCYRRCTFVSQLSFTPTNSPTISLETYTETLKQSVASADLRWLLPTFLTMMPNLDLSKFDDDPANFEPLAQLEFLLPGKGSGKDDAIMGFGEAGRSMGVEFYRSWFQSTGFEISVLTNKKWHTVHRGFLSPTGLANHLILMETGEDGAVVFNHQAMTRQALEFKLSNLLNKVLSFKPDKTTSLPGGDKKAADASAAAKCSSCATPLAPGQNFCPNCGASSQEKKKETVCPSCSNPVKPEAKFCPHCGNKL